MTQLTLRTPAVLGRTAWDQIFDQFFNDPRPMIKRSTDGYPLSDIYRDEDNNQVIEMALAGFTKEDIQIEVKLNVITISHQAEPWKGEDRPQRRIARRSFTKSFVDYNNSLDLAGSVATFENGLLKVIISLKEEAKPKTITVQ